jgi:hypothetical protein
MRLAPWFAFALIACGGSSSKTPDAPHNPDAPVDMAVDGPDPRTGDFTLTGGANGITWDAATSTLYLSDSNADALLKFTDAGGVQTVGTFPTESAGISLGDIIKLADGTILTPNFGFGTQGTIFAMSPANQSSALTGLDATRRRIGLAQDSAGTMYVGYFTAAMMMQQGGVGTLTIASGAGTETEIAGTTTSAGFKKIVGIAATTDAVFVSDQTQLTIFKIAIPGNTVTTIASQLPAADLLVLMPNGDLLTGGTGGVHRVTQAGTVTTPFTGFESVRGMAYDTALKRLFFIEHSATVTVPDKLHVRPLDN